MKNTTCNHIMDSGRPCGSPPLHGKSFCYWHHRLRQDFNLPGTPGYRAPLLESPNSVLVALNHVYFAQARNLIHPRLAASMQSSLRLALQTFRQLDHPGNSEVATHPTDFGANLAAMKVVDADRKEATPLAPSAAAGAPQPSAANVHGARNSTASTAPLNPFVTNDRPAKSPVWDPEGCLSHYTAREKSGRRTG